MTGISRAVGRIAGRSRGRDFGVDVSTKIVEPRLKPVLAASVAPSHAEAGFSCAQTASPIETLICGDREPSDLDGVFAQTFAKKRPGLSVDSSQLSSPDALKALSLADRCFGAGISVSNWTDNDVYFGTGSGTLTYVSWAGAGILALDVNGAGVTDDVGGREPLRCAA